MSRPLPLLAAASAPIALTRVVADLGEIIVESRPGFGSTFRVELPLVDR
jgi:signal transduction histidine kinase